MLSPEMSLDGNSDGEVAITCSHFACELGIRRLMLRDFQEVVAFRMCGVR